jgi:hypothetical protein
VEKITDLPSFNALVMYSRRSDAAMGFMACVCFVDLTNVVAFRLLSTAVNKF